MNDYAEGNDIYDVFTVPVGYLQYKVREICAYWAREAKRAAPAPSLRDSLRDEARLADARRDKARRDAQMAAGIAAFDAMLAWAGGDARRVLRMIDNARGESNPTAQPQRWDYWAADAPAPVGEQERLL